MELERQIGWGKLFLILTVLSCCSAITVTIQKPNYEVARGGDITMTCSFKPARPVTDSLVVRWDTSPDVPGEPRKSVASLFLNKPADIAPDYEGRASMEVNMNTLVSTLRITGVTMEDNREFQCMVLIHNDDEGSPADTTSLLVLVAPSAPVCKVEGSAVFWSDISLTCMSEEGSPDPTYKWTSYSVENVQRQLPPKSTEENGKLSLLNISSETTGYYICVSTNRIGSAKCNLTLAVTANTMDFATTAGIIGGVVAGFVVLGIIVYCTCCRKKGEKNEDTEGSPAEKAYYDKDAPAAEVYLDDKSNTKSKQQYKDEDKDDNSPQSISNLGAASKKAEDDRYSDHSSRGRNDGIDSRRYQDDPRNEYRGSRDRLDDRRDNYRGSRDRLDDRRDDYRGSRDRLDDRRDDYRGSRDRLDERRDDYRGSRDRLDDRHDYRGSRDRLDDRRDNYRGSQDRLDDRHDHYGSRNHIDVDGYD